MIVNLYSVFDKKTLVFSPPFPAPTHGAAQRLIKDTASSDGNQLGKYPDDFALYHIGIFDDSEGYVGFDPDQVMPVLVVEVSTALS